MKKQEEIREEIHDIIGDCLIKIGCGEGNFEFLAIDHTNGGGRQEQKARGNGNIHQWLRARNYPEGYRVLCHNCNMSLGFYGYCPHGNITRGDNYNAPSEQRSCQYEFAFIR